MSNLSYDVFVNDPPPQNGLLPKREPKRIVVAAWLDQKGKYMPNLNWKLLTKKRNGSTQGLPPGKEDLAWVTNTVTLIYSERDAVLVDTFLSVQHSKELVD